jgi:rhodanese-related sulfurtransferase
MSALLPTGRAKGQSKSPKTYRQITVKEAVTMMKTESGYVILDVRRPEEYAAGHIPYAINLPNETIGTSEIPELPDRDQLILVYCRSGRRSKEAAEKLCALGYTNVVEFGGILDWTGEIVTES